MMQTREILLLRDHYLELGSIVRDEINRTSWYNLLKLLNLEMMYYHYRYEFTYYNYLYKLKEVIS